MTDRIFLRHACDVSLVNRDMTPRHCKPILPAATYGGGADVKLEFCVACGSKDDLQHRHLVTKAKGGGGAERNLITLCTGCHDRLHQHRYDAHKHSKRIKTALAARRARGASVGRPKKLMPDQCKEALRRLESGESMAAVARSYSLSTSTVRRMVRSTRLSGRPAEADLILQVADAATSPLLLSSATLA